jgi:hypothetical protein
MEEASGVRCVVEGASMNNQLAHFRKAKRELALVTRIDEIKEIRDKAEALRAYAKQAGESLEMQITRCYRFRCLLWWNWA